MKKIISLMVALLIAMGCAFAFSSCGKKDDKENEDITPYKDYKKAAEALEDANYQVYVIDSSDELEDIEEYYDISGLEAVVRAEHEDEDDELVYIFYFEDEDALKDSKYGIDDLLDEFKEEAEEEDIKVEIGKSGAMAWVGTEKSVKVAAGERVSIGSKDDEDDNRAPILNSSAPNSTPSKAKSALEKAGYKVTLLEGEDTGNNKLEAIVLASMDDDVITIAYYATKADANEVYDEALQNLEELGDDYEDYVVGIKDTMVWMGTEAAVKAAK